MGINLNQITVIKQFMEMRDLFEIEHIEEDDFDRRDAIVTFHDKGNQQILVSRHGTIFEDGINVMELM